MGEHVPDDGSLTPKEARDTIARLEAFEAPLRRRTGGITWMIWAIVTAGIFISYEMVQGITLPGPVLWFLWAPWVAAGQLLTGAVWNSVALTLGLPEGEEAKRGVAIGLVITAFFFGSALVFFGLGAPVPVSVFWLVLLGGFTWVMGAASAPGRADRVASSAAGTWILGLAVVDAWVGVPFAAFVTLMPAAWLVAGAYMAFRG